MPFIPRLLMLPLALWAATGQADVVFTEFTVSQVSTTEQLDVVGVSTAQVAGVAAMPGAADDVFALHVDTLDYESVLRIPVSTGVPVKLNDATHIASDLGAPYTANFTLTGGFTYSPATDEVVLADSAHGAANEVSLIAVDATVGTAELVARSANLNNLSDHAALPDGNLLVARAGDGVAGIITRADGTWTQKLTATDLLPLAPGTAALPPQVVATNIITGEAMLGAGGDGEVFKLANLNAASPAITRLVQPDMTGNPMADVALDQAGNLYAYDSTANRLVIVDVRDGTTHQVPMSAIAAGLGGTAPFVPTAARGLAARIASATETDLFLASSTSDYGVVRVRFGTAATRVNDWAVY